MNDGPSAAEEKTSKAYYALPAGMAARFGRIRLPSLVCDDQHLRHLDRNLSSRAKADLILHTPLVFQRLKSVNGMSVMAASAPSVLCTVTPV